VRGGGNEAKTLGRGQTENLQTKSFRSKRGFFILYKLMGAIARTGSKRVKNRGGKDLRAWRGVFFPIMSEKTTQDVICLCGKGKSKRKASGLSGGKLSWKRYSNGKRESFREGGEEAPILNQSNTPTPSGPGKLPKDLTLCNL